MIDTVGEIIFWATISDAVAVHPLAVSVTVTLYVAGAVTVMPAVSAPLLQLNVIPAAGVGVAVSVSLMVVQFN